MNAAPQWFDVSGYPFTLWQELAWLLEDGSTPEPNTGCLLWTGKTTREGYGQFCWRGVKFLAHRAAFSLVHGDLPSSLDLHHSCEQPSCLRERHLSPVTSTQHRRLHNGAGQLVTRSAAPVGAVDLFAVLAQLQAAEGLTLPFPFSQISRFDRGDA